MTMPISTANATDTATDPRWRVRGVQERKGRFIVICATSQLVAVRLYLFAEPLGNGLAEAVEIPLPRRGGHRTQDGQRPAGTTAIRLRRHQCTGDVPHGLVPLCR